MKKKRIICYGEVLWDCLPRGLFLGGAPLNVAYHLRQLGEEPLMVSALGKDFLGEETLARIEKAGVDVSYVRILTGLPTGAVRVLLSEKGDASYNFIDPAAWDEIAIDPELAKGADALIYGSLAMRKQSNRTQLEAALAACRGLKICDINLRPGFDDPEYAMQLLALADVAKLNEDELATLSGIPVETDDPRPAMEHLASLTGTKRICLTMGGKGAAYFEADKYCRVAVEPVEVRDTIGAGDAFMARLIHGMLSGEAMEQNLQTAANLGAFIATKDGAQPSYDARPFLNSVD